MEISSLYTDKERTEAMFACGYLFHCIHEIETTIEKNAVVPSPLPYLVAAFYTPLSYLLPSEAMERAILDCIHMRLSSSSDSSDDFDLFCHVCVQLKKDIISQFSEHDIDISQFYVLSVAYDITPDEWFSTYRKPFLSTTASICSLLIASNPSDKNKPASASHPFTRTEHTVKKKSIVLLSLISIIAIIVIAAFIIIFSQQKAPANSTSAPAIETETSTQTSSTVVDSAHSSGQDELADGTEIAPLSLPQNGRHYPTYDFTNSTFSSICVHAPTNLNCFVIVKRAGKDIILDRFFVRANQTVDTFLSVGELDVFFAFGDEWYGEDHLFGDDTSCQVDRGLDVSDAYGYEYTLYPVKDGNLTMPSVTIEEMLAG